jgi:hypothetical protein
LGLGIVMIAGAMVACASSRNDTGSSDAGTEVPDGAILAQGYEQGGCDAWKTDGVNVTLAEGGHGGGQACMVCLTTDTSALIFQEVPYVGDGNYTLDVWAMSGDDAGTGVVVGLVLVNSSMMAQSTPQLSQSKATAGEWQKLTTATNGTGNPAFVRVFMYPGTETKDRCFYVDDLLLVRH